jgi:hypothetical protein
LARGFLRGELKMPAVAHDTVTITTLENRVLRFCRNPKAYNELQVKLRKALEVAGKEQVCWANFSKKVAYANGILRAYGNCLGYNMNTKTLTMRDGDEETEIAKVEPSTIAYIQRQGITIPMYGSI